MQYNSTINGYTRDTSGNILEELSLVAASNYSLQFNTYNEDGTGHDLSVYDYLNLVIKNGTVYNSFATQSSVNFNEVVFDLYPSVLTYQIESTSANYVVIDSAVEKQFIKNDQIVITDSSVSGTYYISSVTKDAPALGQTKLTLTSTIGSSTGGKITHYEIHGNPSTIDYKLYIYGVDGTGNITQLVTNLLTTITPAVNPTLSIQTPFIFSFGIGEAPLDGESYLRKDGDWITITNLLKAIYGYDSSNTKKQVLCCVNGQFMWKTAKKCNGTDA